MAKKHGKSYQRLTPAHPSHSLPSLRAILITHHPLDHADLATFGVTFSNTSRARFSWTAVSNATSYLLWGTKYTAKTSLNVANLNSSSLATDLTSGDWWFSVHPTNTVGSGPGAVALRFMVK